MDKKDIKLALQWVKGELTYKDVSYALGYKTHKSGTPYVRLALLLKAHINNQKKKK